MRRFAATLTIASKDYFARRESKYLFRKPNCAMREGSVLIDSQGALRVDGEALESEPRRD
jgi:hypothetical protein